MGIFEVFGLQGTGDVFVTNTLPLTADVTTVVLETEIEDFSLTMEIELKEP